MTSPYDRNRRNPRKNKNNKTSASREQSVSKPQAVAGTPSNAISTAGDFRAGSRPNRNASVKKMAVGTSAIDAIQKWTISLKPFELQFPENMKTYHIMFTQDEAIGSVLNTTYTLVGKAFYNGKVNYNATSEQSKRAAKLVDHLLNNMKEGTIHSFARDAATFAQFGFSTVEKDYYEMPRDEYLGDLPDGVGDTIWALDRLMLLPQRSLDPSEPFVISDDGRSVLALRQNSNWFTNSSHALYNWMSPAKTVTVRRNKFMLMGINATSANPFGVSPLEQVWKVWKEKEFYTNYLSVGVSKDMAGMPLMLVPKQILDEANDDPNSDSYRLVKQMAEDISAMHAGEQNMAILPSDVMEGNSSQRQFDMKFLGVEGVGKQFNLKDIIKDRVESIYATMGALNLFSGSGGSYNQWEGQNTIHTFTVQNIVRIIEDAINRDLIPQILKLNNIVLSDEDKITYSSGDVEPISFEEFSKMIQRIASVGLFPMTPEFINEVLERTDFTYRIPSEFKSYPDANGWSYEDFKSIMCKYESNAGEGEGTSGTGDSQNSTGGDNNADNAA